jgi:hypothetical protein
MSKKIGCFFLHLSNEQYGNFIGDNFFSNNALNSFKKFHPEIDIIYINDNNFQLYLKELNIIEYYDNMGTIRIHIIRELMKQKHYDKIIMLGIDTFTCDKLSEFLDNNEDDVICSSNAPYTFMKTEHWAPLIETFEYNGGIYQDVSLINADVTCFNSLKGAEIVYSTSIKYWSNQAEQGGLNYCYINQKELNLKVSIVDFPYIKTNVLYNVHSKGKAFGGYQMYRGKLYNGSYKDPNSSVIGDIYPTSTYYVKDNKLYTNDHKQIKIFHYAEGLGNKNKEEYNETLNEIKTIWFNKETIEFLTNQCNCRF